MFRNRLRRIATVDNALIVLAVVGLSCAVTSHSLWIDEGFTAWLAAHRSPHALVNLFADPMFPAPDRQYLFYELWIVGWTRLFGYSEFALRAANIPFAAIFVVALAMSSRLVFRRRFAWIPFAATPFAWFYMNEARSYMMLLAVSMVTAGALGTAVFGAPELRARAGRLFFWSLIVTSMTNVLSFLAFPGLLVLLVVGVRAGTLDARQLLGRALRFAPLFALVALYYASTLGGPRVHAEISLNTRRTPSLAFSLVSLYEEAGFAGIGPPRNDVRAKVSGSALLPYVVLLAITALAYLAALVLSLRRRPDPATIALLCAWAASFVFAAVISSALGGRFLGRHLAAVMPFLLLASIGLFRSRLALVLISGVFLVSDLRLSFVPEYGKDDYRAAVADVIDRQKRSGGQIDWSADGMTANYYGLALRYPANLAAYADVGWPSRAAATWVAGWDADAAKTLVDRQLREGPVYIAISKPDVYDLHDAWSIIVLRPSATLVAQYQSFKIYELRIDKSKHRRQAEAGAASLKGT